MGVKKRLIQAARRDRVDGLVAASVLKKAKKKNNCNMGRRKLYMTSI